MGGDSGATLFCGWGLIAGEGGAIFAGAAWIAKAFLLASLLVAICTGGEIGVTGTLISFALKSFLISDSFVLACAFVLSISKALL